MALTTLNSVLMQSGRPVLVVPPGDGASVFRQIALFWNGSTEATRAVAGALPFLTRAERVTVLRVEEEEWFAPTDDLEVYLARHGETEWSSTGRHTSFTDVPLTAEGERSALAVAALLAGKHFDLVLSSPMRRAMDTCRLAGYGGARITNDLAEWNYGSYEGRTTPEIQQEQPDWTIWSATQIGRAHV